MAVNLSPFGGVGAQFLDNSGNVLTGGKIYAYQAGTTTPQPTYTSSSGNVPLPNPIILDAAGRVPTGEIWLTDGLIYKFVLTDSNDVLIATYDNVLGINSNFVNFTNQQEIQIATANQTVFNLANVAYQPGTNNLSVFVDGVNQYGPGAQYAYVETDSDTVTFTNGLHVGAEVKFTTSQINSSAGQNAAQTAFTGFKGQVGNVQDLADNDGSDWVGFIQGGTSAIGRSVQDKTREQISATDYSSASTDIGAAVNEAFAYLATLYNPSALIGIRGGLVTLPLGTKSSTTPIDLERHSSGTSSKSVYGQGQATSDISLTGAPAFTDGVSSGVNGQTFGVLSDFGVSSAPRSGFRMDKYSRTTYKNLSASGSGADGYYFGNGFVTVHEKNVSTNNAANGFNYANSVQHTSHVINGGYAQNNSGTGWALGLMNYSVGNALAADGNTLYGYAIGSSSGFVLNGCGAETNGRSGFFVSSDATSQTTSFTINNAWAYFNNQSSSGYPNLLYVLGTGGYKAHVRITKSKSIPRTGITTQDIIADGLGAEIEIDDCEMPNGWLARNGGYIHWVHKTLVVRNLTVPLATPTAICNLRSTQGYAGAQYNGKITVCAYNNRPDATPRNNAIYDLLICSSLAAGFQVIEIAKAGQVTGLSGSAPSFTWSIVADQLVATPIGSTGGTAFWFEVDASSQVVALPL